MSNLDLADFLLVAFREERKARAERAQLWVKLAADVYERGHPWQRGVNDDPGRNIVIVTGRGCGKTETICERLARRMLMQPDQRCIYFATTREQVIDLLWEPFKDLLGQLGIADDCKLLEVPLRCRMPNGSRIQMVGADDMKSIEKHRGKPYDEAWIDECASFPVQLIDHLMNRVIRPRLRRGGTLGMAGTPGHHFAGEFYEASRPGSELSRRWEERDKLELADRQWSFHTWSQKDGAEYVEAISDIWEQTKVEVETKYGGDWSHPEVMRERLGLWAADDTDHVFRYKPHTDDGAPWNQWDPPRDPQSGVAILPDIGGKDGWLYGWGIDLGHTDPLALEVFAWHPADVTRTLYHVYEFSRREFHARAFAELVTGERYVKEMAAGRDPGEPEGLIGATSHPSLTAVDDAGMGGSYLKELREVYGIPLEEADKKDKFGAIEGFNGDLLGGRIKILKGSILESQLIHNQWSKDDFGQFRRNKGQRDDCVDGAVYIRARAARQFGKDAAPVTVAKVSDYHRAGAEVVHEVRSEFDSMFDAYSDEAAWG